MLKTSQSTNITGQSMIMAGDTLQVAVRMNASIQSDGVISISKTIQDKPLYIKNKDECTKDMDEFEAKAINTSQEEQA